MTKKLFIILLALTTQFAYGQTLTKYTFERTDIGQEKTRKKSATAAIPYVFVQPSNLKLCQGNTMRLVAMTNTPKVLNYKWMKNGTAIQISTSNEFVVNSFSSSDVGLYTCQATLQDGTTTIASTNSSTISSYPALIFSASSDPVCEGDPLVCSVSAKNNQDIFYQWMRDIENPHEIPGAIYPTYTKDVSFSYDNNTFFCRLTGACGSFYSNSVGSVNPKPQGGTLSIQLNGAIPKSLYTATQYNLVSAGYYSQLMYVKMDGQQSNYLNPGPLTFSQPGIYTFYNVASTSYCSSFANSAIYTYTVYSSNKKAIKDTSRAEIKSSLTLFPNPNDGQFSIVVYSVEKGICSYIVRDINGRAILESQFEKSDVDALQQIALPNASNGVYFFRLKLNEQEFDARFVVKK